MATNDLNEPEMALDADGLRELARRVECLRHETLCADDSPLAPMATQWFCLAHTALAQAEHFMKMAALDQTRETAALQMGRR